MALERSIAPKVDMHSALPHVRSLFLKKRPVHLTYFVTRRCNAGCPFCFYRASRRAESGAPELSLGEIRRVAGSMGRLLWLLFSGGEPFLREDLAEVSEAFHDANRVTFLTYPTNGLLPEVVAGRTEEILRRCPESVVVLKLSLDGVGADHDAVRRTPGGFDRAMRTHERLARLAERHPRLELGVNTLFCSETQERVDGIIDFVRGLEGVRSHTLTLVRGELREERYREIDLGAYERACRHLDAAWGTGDRRFHRFAGGRLKAAQDRVQRRLIHRTVSRRRRTIPCQAGRLDLVMTESGELHPCEGRWGDSFGNVRDAGYDVGRMLRSERAARILDDISRGDCWCSHECNFLTNILFHPGTYPELLRDWARGAAGAAPDAGSRPVAVIGRRCST
jgi:MoaA/NifB/PqqE/SkfB family radical SAM enzyme